MSSEDYDCVLVAVKAPEAHHITYEQLQMILHGLIKHAQDNSSLYVLFNEEFHYAEVYYIPPREKRELLAMIFFPRGFDVKKFNDFMRETVKKYAIENEAEISYGSGISWIFDIKIRKEKQRK